MEVYVVTKGSYSDFGIDSIWSTKEKAEIYIKEKHRGNYDQINDDVDIYEIDSEPFPKVKTLVKMDQMGNTLETKLTTLCANFVGFCDEDWMQENSKEGILYWVVDTEDQTRAIKATNEKRAIILAHNLWGNWEGTRELFEKNIEG